MWKIGFALICGICVQVGAYGPAAIAALACIDYIIEENLQRSQDGVQEQKREAND